MKTEFTEQELDQFSSSVSQKMRDGGLVFLIGDLGSGKTTFTKYLASQLGIEKFSIKSPTYTYIRPYNNFYHIDLYRLDQADQLLIQEILEILENPQNLVVIEWAERISEYLPAPDLTLKFEYIDPQRRKITQA